MATEADWSRTLHQRLELELKQPTYAAQGWEPRIEVGKKLTYAHEISRYGADGPVLVRSAPYQTDLLIYDCNPKGEWIPRFVIELKTWGITTHDALTYSAKAATHKQVHPYVRYGVLIGDFGDAVPGRLLRHGAYFDFMMVWWSQNPSEAEWKDSIAILRDEISASRTLQELLSDSRLRSRKKYWALHRPLNLFAATKRGAEESQPPNEELEAAHGPQMIDDEELATYHSRDQELEDGTAESIPAHEAVAAAMYELREARGTSTRLPNADAPECGEGKTEEQ